MTAIKVSERGKNYVCSRLVTFHIFSVFIYDACYLLNSQEGGDCTRYFNKRFFFVLACW